MTLFTWPQDRSSVLIWYNTLMSVGSTLVAFLANEWVGVATAFAWCFFFSWDLFIRTWVYPVSDLSDEERAQMQMEEWLSRQGEQSHRRMREISERLTNIEEQYAKMKQENKELRVLWGEVDAVE